MLGHMLLMLKVVLAQSEGEPGSWPAQDNDHLLAKGLAESVALDSGALMFHVVGIQPQGPLHEDWLLNKLCFGQF